MIKINQQLLMVEKQAKQQFKTIFNSKLFSIQNNIDIKASLPKLWGF